MKNALRRVPGLVRGLGFALCIAMGTSMVQPLEAEPLRLASNFAQEAPAALPMVSYGPALEPYGHTEFCRTNSKLCQGGGDARIAISSGTWRDLNAVNKDVNKRIRPVLDGPVERWKVNEAAGDCKDYALTKKATLIEKGFDPNALSIATVALPDGQHHAVLLVRTTRGEMVLDNRRSRILPWDRAGYQWQRRQSAENPRIWESLAPAPAGPRMAAIPKTENFPNPAGWAKLAAQDRRAVIDQWLASR
jgi:predicted transglutaminase-like cysteine proteinase